MPERERNEMAAAIIKHYGAEAQKDILIEECAELIQAVEKSRRQSDRPSFTSDMIEEMADVSVLLLQFRTMMGAYWFGRLERTIDEKLMRQIERIDCEG